MSIGIHQPVSGTSLTPPSHPTSLGLDIFRPGSAPIPNKHLPYCPPGPVPGEPQQTPTPPASPPTKHTGLQTTSPLHPADAYPKVVDQPTVHAIDASTLAAAVDELSTQQIPDPKLVFPWLHGLHDENQVQLAFFIARRKALRNTPKCFRGITIVKVGGDLTRARLKGAISEEEIIDVDKGQDATFLEVDPKDGFSVRNFQIQTTKMATVSDIVVYGDDTTNGEEMRALACRLANAQRSWHVKDGNGDETQPQFSTFILSSKYIHTVLGLH